MGAYCACVDNQDDSSRTEEDNDENSKNKQRFLRKRKLEQSPGKLAGLRADVNGGNFLTVGGSSSNDNSSSSNIKKNNQNKHNEYATNGCSVDKQLSQFQSKNSFSHYAQGATLAGQTASLLKQAQLNNNNRKISYRGTEIEFVDASEIMSDNSHRPRELVESLDASNMSQYLSDDRSVLLFGNSQRKETLTAAMQRRSGKFQQFQEDISSDDQQSYDRARGIKRKDSTLQTQRHKKCTKQPYPQQQPRLKQTDELSSGIYSEDYKEDEETVQKANNKLAKSKGKGNKRMQVKHSSSERQENEIIESFQEPTQTIQQTLQSNTGQELADQQTNISKQTDLPNVQENSKFAD